MSRSHLAHPSLTPPHVLGSLRSRVLATVLSRPGRRGWCDPRPDAWGPLTQAPARGHTSAPLPHQGSFFPYSGGGDPEIWSITANGYSSTLELRRQD